jgi:SNF2 family DNA or RNA helicase
MPELYKFQKVAVTQLLEHQWHMEQAGTPDKSVLIGDDMGLGKTVEAIGLDLNYRRRNQKDYTGQTLVVTMTSVMGAWAKHYADWAPWLKVKVIDRKNRNDFIKALTARKPNGTPEYQVFICHWQVLRFIAEDLKKVSWFHIVGDEIQNIKNRAAQQTQHFKKLRTEYKTGLSGTWADNAPDDAYSVLNWLWPKRWSSYWKFFNYHVLQKRHNDGYCLAEDCGKNHKRAFTEVVGMHDAELIHGMMGKAYVRRLKDEVWEDMPEKTYDDRIVELDPKQRRAYDAMEKDMITWVGANEDQPLPAPSVISQLVRLQQAGGLLQERSLQGKEQP